jgi:hypothetical protein
MRRAEGEAPCPEARGPALWVALAQYGVLGLLIALLVTFTGTVLGAERFPDLLGGVLLAGFLGLLVLLFGPTRLTTALFLVSMLLFHQHLSVFIVPAGGVEWHPRELLLFLFLAHAAVQLVARRVSLWEDPVHFYMAVYLGFYVLTGAVGLTHQYVLQEIIEECRYPVFLASYPALLVCVRGRQEIFAYSRLVCLVTVLVAAASVLFFLYTLTLGSVINVQNAYGAFVQRQVGPLLLQSVRANGHMYFEIGLVMLVSLLACPAVRLRRKVLYAGVCVLFAAAIVITMMRTAYVAVGLSLALLVLLSLPSALRRVALFAGTFTVSVVLVVFGLALYETIQAALPDVEVSLKGRTVEMAGAWEEFVAHPLVGVGMGRSFEAFGYVAKTSELSYAQSEYQTLHNVWMYFLFKGGLAGMLLAVVGLVGLGLRGVQLVDRLQDPFERFYARGLAAAFAGQLVASLAMPRLTYPQGHVFVAMVAVAFLWLARQPAPLPPAASAD